MHTLPITKINMKTHTFEGTDKIWSAILNPVQGEMAKDKAVKILSDVFSFSDEEARELLQNAPVILFEDISHDQAERILNFMEDRGLPLVITDSLLQKRKCFRTVWMNAPDLGFLDREPVPAEMTPVSMEREKALSAGEAIVHIREELNGAPDAEKKEPRRSGANDYQRKYESLWREHNMLVEERLIQDRKIETLEKEVRLLREKENCYLGDLKLSHTEKDTLRQELEAQEICNELLTKQVHEQNDNLTKLANLETSEKVLKERFAALVAEFADTEKVWAERISQVDLEKKHLEQDCENLRATIKELTTKLGEAERKQEELISREALSWCERALKELVKRQEELEGDITGREKLLKAILSEQEKLEQEILRFKKFRN